VRLQRNTKLAKNIYFGVGLAYQGKGYIYLFIYLNLFLIFCVEMMGFGLF